MCAAPARHYGFGPTYLHTAVLTGLEPRQRYFYQVRGGQGGLSRRARPGDEPGGAGWRSIVATVRLPGTLPRLCPRPSAGTAARQAPRHALPAPCM